MAKFSFSKNKPGFSNHLQQLREGSLLFYEQSLFHISIKMREKGYDHPSTFLYVHVGVLAKTF